MSLQTAYNQFASGCWADPDADACPCRGGWFLSDLDTWHKCPEHYAGQPHPDEYYDAPAPPRPGNDDVPNPDDIPEDERCPKCGGHGVIFRYIRRDNGRCYLCQGSGVDPNPRKEDKMPEKVNLSEFKPDPSSEKARAGGQILIAGGVVESREAFERYRCERESPEACLGDESEQRGA